MSFLSVGALWWLVPLGGAIVLLYLLKMRRKELRVPAVFLWPPVVYEVRANSLIQRLRFNWLMVLQLIGLAALVFALARPQTRQEGLAGAATVVVIDTSASMSATDVKPSRLSEAVRICGEIVNSVRTTDRLSVIEAGPVPRVVVPLSNDTGKMRQALASVKPTDADADIGEAMRLAASIASRQDGARIILLSDGVFPQVKDFASGKASVEFRRIGSSDRNLAISALGVTETPTGNLGFLSIKNHSDTALGGTLSLRADAKLIDSQRVSVDPGKTFSNRFEVPKGASIIDAKLEADDLLAADNFAAIAGGKGAALSVLLVTRGDFFMERALSLDPRVTLDKATDVPAYAAYDIIVFDGVPEQPVRSRGVMTFGSAGSNPIVSVQGSLKQPSVTRTEAHPLLRGVDLSQTYIEQAQRVNAKAEGKSVVQSAGAPLIVVSEAAQRRVYVAFLPQQSDFPLQVGFPIFLANALDFLAPRETGSDALVVSAGRTFSLPAASESEPLEVSGPTGSEGLSPRGGVYVLRNLTRAGEYKLKAGGKTRTVYATLQSESESAIKPAEQLFMGKDSVAASGTISRLADFWKPLLMLALCVLAFEWWVFARRS